MSEQSPSNQSSVTPVAQTPPPTMGGSLSGLEQQQLLQENNRLLREMHTMMKHARVMSAVRLTVTILLIVVPLLGFLFVFPRVISNVMSQYGSLLGLPQSEYSTSENVFELLFKAE